MDPKKLLAVNKKINNIFETPFPYWWAFQGEGSAPKEGSAGEMVIFFGNDAATFYKMGTDENLYVKRCNECLDYIRREFKGYKLCYKPHPADKAEQTALNLEGFNFLEDKINAELLLLQNHNQIRAVFSLGSASCLSAYSMGLNAHVFYKCFIDVCGDELIRQLDDFYYDMPQTFFIKSFDGKIVDNAPILRKDESMEMFFKEKLDNGRGKIWLTVFTTEYIVILIALAKLIKYLSPVRNIGLVISHHHYWDMIDPDYFKKYFDEIVVLPRVSYSLRPVMLWLAAKTARQIKKFKIDSNDILISASQAGFIENCFVSYHKNILKIGLVANKDFNLHYNVRNLIYACYDNFRFSKASWFFNKIFEPLLGINRSLFMFYGQGKASFIIRYQKPLNEVFDNVIILKSPA